VFGRHPGWFLVVALVLNLCGVGPAALTVVDPASAACLFCVLTALTYRCVCTSVLRIGKQPHAPVVTLFEDHAPWRGVLRDRVGSISTLASGPYLAFARYLVLLALGSQVFGWLLSRLAASPSRGALVRYNMLYHHSAERSVLLRSGDLRRGPPSAASSRRCGVIGGITLATFWGSPARRGINPRLGRARRCSTVCGRFLQGV